MNKDNKIQTFAQKTYENPITQATLTAIDTLPVIGAFTASSRKAMEQAYANAVEERKRTFLDELEKGGEITHKMLETEEFIHSVFVTYSAAMRTFDRDKIRRFARILLTAIDKNELATDKFEEFTRILNDLTDRELEILIILNHMENTFPFHEEDEDDFQRVNRYWDDFLRQVNTHTGTEIELVRYIITGLGRTGLYESFAGMILGYDGGKGKTTALFDDFSEWIKLENEKLNADG